MMRPLADDPRRFPRMSLTLPKRWLILMNVSLLMPFGHFQDCQYGTIIGREHQNENLEKFLAIIRPGKGRGWPTVKGRHSGSRVLPRGKGCLSTCITAGILTRPGHRPGEFLILIFDFLGGPWGSLRDHQCPQKVTITTLPRKLLSVNSLPAMSLPSMSGATTPTDR